MIDMYSVFGYGRYDVWKQKVHSVEQELSADDDGVIRVRLLYLYACI